VWYRRAAALGEPEGVYRLALLAAGDDAERLVVARKAAEAGYAPAQYELAVHFLQGGGAPDAGAGSQGVAWLTKAAGQGHARAQFDLAVVYRDGIHVPSDDASFLLWLRQAAENGMARA